MKENLKSKQEEIYQLALQMHANMIRQFVVEDENYIPCPIDYENYVKEHNGQLTDLAEAFVMAACITFNKIIQEEYNYSEATLQMHRLAVQQSMRKLRLDCAINKDIKNNE